ncbi:MAG: serine hydrolase, partial [Bacteroidota bacterium]
MKYLITCCLIALTVTTSAQTGIPIPGMSHCDQLVNNFLSTYDIPGATFAMAKDGKLVYARGFGEANLAGTELTQPHHLFRIASVSKPITSIAVMKLVEQQRLNLSDPVFGSNGLLAQHPYLGSVSYSDTRINQITVQQLLEHTAGWNRNQTCVPSPTPPYPYGFNTCDPIAFPLHVTQTLGENNPVTEEMHIRFLMERGLDFTPGTQYAYSNIGYLVLGEVIEQVSGLTYEDFLQQEIFEPIGACDFHIGKNLLSEKQEREAEYQGNGFTNLAIDGSGQQVPWEYGGFNVEAMSAHGGWIASARDLVRLLTAVDGFATKPDILNASSIQTMTTPSAQAAYYAKGWSVNSVDNWWHTGAIDGTASLAVRTNGGFTWAIILNQRIVDNRANAFWSELDNLPWLCMAQTSNFPTHDLFEVPQVSSQDFVFEPQGSQSLKVSWTPGDGDQRLLVIKAGSPVDGFPLDGQNYQANAGAASDLGGGNLVAYQGNGNSVTLTGLDPSLTYYFRL